MLVSTQQHPEGFTGVVFTVVYFHLKTEFSPSVSKAKTWIHFTHPPPSLDTLAQAQVGSPTCLPTRLCILRAQHDVFFGSSACQEAGLCRQTDIDAIPASTTGLVIMVRSSMASSVKGDNSYFPGLLGELSKYDAQASSTGHPQQSQGPCLPLSTLPGKAA